MALKRKKQAPLEVEDVEEEYEGMDEEELEEEELEELEKVEKRPKRKVAPSPSQNPAPVQRYNVFSQAARFGIVDVETKEVIAEGEMGVIQALADILGRLERIENNIGSLME